MDAWSVSARLEIRNLLFGSLTEWLDCPIIASSWSASAARSLNIVSHTPALPIGYGDEARSSNHHNVQAHHARGWLAIPVRAGFNKHSIVLCRHANSVFSSRQKPSNLPPLIISESVAPYHRSAPPSG